MPFTVDFRNRSKAAPPLNKGYQTLSQQVQQQDGEPVDAETRSPSEQLNEQEKDRQHGLSVLFPKSKKGADSPAQNKRSKRDSRERRVLLAGYFGYDNLGDELILHVWIRELKSRGCQVTVLSHQPEVTAQRYGVKSIQRLNLLDLIDAFSEIDWLIFGGGGLFQDVTGPGSAFYYGSLAMMADFFKVPVLLWNQGMGPLKQLPSRFVTKRVLEGAHGVTVRDSGSADLVQELTMVRPPVTADPVWLLEPPAPANPPMGNPHAWRIAISLRPHHQLTDSNLMALVYFFKHLIGVNTPTPRPVEFLLLPMQPDQDMGPLLKFSKGVKELGGFAECKLVPAERVPAGIAESHLLFGMRFHSLVLGILCEIPVYGLMYDPKVTSLIEGLGLQGMPIAAIDKMDENALREYFAHYPFPDVTSLRQRALAGFETLDQVMNPLSAPI